MNMASLSLTLPLVGNTSFCSSLPNKCQTPRITNPKLTSRRNSISCEANDAGDRDTQNPSNGVAQPPLPRLDRRNVLLGLGGLYGATSLASDPWAVADPVLPPDLSKCISPVPKGKECCPPFSDNIVDFRQPRHACLRLRPAAHTADRDYITKYERALALMKKLPADDPRSFDQQAKVHCAYCEGGYKQVGFEDVDLQVHDSWLFFPFHRWYLYFYEKILGKLIDDPTFAIPFWNWDSPVGMEMPAMFTNNCKSPLYDYKRSETNQPPYIFDFDYDKDKGNVEKPDREKIATNLCIMHRQMVSGAKVPSLFFGGPYRAGNVIPNDKKKRSPGTIEKTPHTQIHQLSGSPKENGEDMGKFYAAGYDPMFYALHGNVDRMWSVWKTLGGQRKDLTDSDWLNAAFLFYDENAQLVRVSVKDSLDTKKLGYVYEDVPIPWLHKKPTPKRNRHKKHLHSLGIVPAAAAAPPPRLTAGDFPVTLSDKPVSVVVARPKVARSQEEKEEEEEVVVIEGIEFDHEAAVKFNVYLNDEDEGSGQLSADKTEFAGAFVNVPHTASGSGESHKLAMQIGVTDLIDDIGADEDENVIVTLVPKTGDPISIDRVKIIFIS